MTVGPALILHAPELQTLMRFTLASLAVRLLLQQTFPDRVSYCFLEDLGLIACDHSFILCALVF